MSNRGIQKYFNQMAKNKRMMKLFVTRLTKNLTPNKSKSIIIKSDEVWSEINCLDCANCCKQMTPTYTIKDMKRIAKYLNISLSRFKEKYLYYQKSDKDWVNNSTPCKFLDLTNHHCTIYEQRPEDCRKFPHHHKSPLKDYIHVHHQNLSYCPATYRWLEKIKIIESEQKQ